MPSLKALRAKELRLRRQIEANQLLIRCLPSDADADKRRAAKLKIVKYTDQLAAVIVAASEQIDPEYVLDPAGRPVAVYCRGEPCCFCG
jgi:hypothetical protein